ncbi:MAG: helix-turn-helix transcriptional regulator, partial [Myxococcales bacterium]|nr:helix-turn-helix transcriptional regulator [Myxococcales bacterium]
MVDRIPDGLAVSQLRLGDVELLVLHHPVAVAPDSPLEQLTPRQREVALLALDGSSNADIARKCSVHARVVAKHLAAAYRRLGVGSRAELAALL